MLDEIDYSPVVLLVPFQPEPEIWQVCRTPGGEYTAIVRHWEPGDVARCRLCPAGRCVATDDYCLLMVRGGITQDDAKLFDATGLRWPERKGGRS